MNDSAFINELKVRGIFVNEEQINLLHCLTNDILFKNESMNLTAITDPSVFLEKMIFDSALGLYGLDLNNKKVIDIGTGAGFPGLVLRTLSPDIELTLLDSTSKKIDFLKELNNKYSLNLKFASTRCEDYAQKNREAFDYAFARAVAPANILIELIVPLLKVGGTLVLMKGLNYENELSEASVALKKLDCHLEKVIEDVLPECQERRAIIHIVKDKPSLKKYPREYRLIKDKPL